MVSQNQTVCRSKVDRVSSLSLVAKKMQLKAFEIAYAQVRTHLSREKGGGGGGGSSVGRARDSWSGGPGFDPRCGRPLPTGWVGVSIM